jgi:hypothetical protein
MDDSRLAVLGGFTPQGFLTPGYKDSYLFFVGVDDVHGILLQLIGNEKLGFDFNQFGYDDPDINAAIIKLINSPNILVQGTLDKSQAAGTHESSILTADKASDPTFFNSILVGQSATHQISHTKGGVLVGQGVYFEGSTNWSVSGEGTGIDVKSTTQPTGWKAQNNTLLVSVNPTNLLRFKTQLAIEHKVALSQQKV